MIITNHSQKKKKKLNTSYHLPKKYNFLKIFIFFSPDFSNHVGKCLDKKAAVNFKIYGVIKWKINNYNTHIVQYL